MISRFCLALKLLHAYAGGSDFTPACETAAPHKMCPRFIPAIGTPTIWYSTPSSSFTSGPFAVNERLHCIGVSVSVNGVNDRDGELLLGEVGVFQSTAGVDRHDFDEDRVVPHIMSAVAAAWCRFYVVAKFSRCQNLGSTSTKNAPIVRARA
jgi:hypothetical protein